MVAKKPSKPSTTPKARSKAAAASPPERMSLAETMAALERAGTAQARKIYARHGAPEPMFGVSFADLKVLVKRIKVDHDLALGLWETENYDARVLAAKIADPTVMTTKDLDRWSTARLHTYVAWLAAEGPHGRDRAEAWLASSSEIQRANGWHLVGALALIDVDLPLSWFNAHLNTIAAKIHSAPNIERGAMNSAVIAIGSRDEATRKAAVAAAKRIGPVTLDHGETDCRTPDAAVDIAKAWAYSASREAASPAALERSREPMRTRC
jgi:3-methyladenine DNA glycosylase AlkD